MGVIPRKQGLGQSGLHAHEVDQKAQCPHIAGQPIEHPLRLGTLQTELCGQYAFDVLAHALAGMGRRIHAQHRQDPAYALQLHRHIDQMGRLLGFTEELVHAFFALTQGPAQLLNHRAHGLTVCHLAIEVLHPGLERSRFMAINGLLDALGQARQARAVLGLLQIGLLKTGLQVQQAGGHLHGQNGRWRLRLRGHKLLRASHGRGQLCTVGHQAHDGLAQQSKRLLQIPQAHHLASGHCGPGLLGRSATLERQGQDGGIVFTQDGASQIDGVVFLQAKGASDLVQDLHRLAIFGLRLRQFTGLGTKKQQLIGQAVRGQPRAFDQHAQLPQKRGQDPLGIHVQGDASAVDGLKKPTRQHPGGRFTVRAPLLRVGSQARAQLGQGDCVFSLGTAQQPQQGLFKSLDGQGIRPYRLPLSRRRQGRLQ